MNWYSKAICGCHDGCLLWKRVDRATHTEQLMAERLERAMRELREAKADYQAHLDAIGEAA